MSKMNRSWSEVSGLNQGDFEVLCPTNGYAVQPISSLTQEIIPNSMRCKLLDQVFIASTGVNNCCTAYTLNFSRNDEKQTAIDQEPFTVVFADGKQTASACFIHHGDWYHRTTPSISAQIYQQDTNQVEYRYSTSEFPKKVSGTLQELEVKSQQEALKKSIEPFLNLRK